MIADAIDAFATGTYTVTRSSPSAYGSDGRLDAPSTSNFTATMCIQPLTGRELQRLPEGLRTRELLGAWSPVELKTQGAGQDADTLVVDGDTYEVERVERWAALGGYCKAVIAKVGR